MSQVNENLISALQGESEEQQQEPQFLNRALLDELNVGAASAEDFVTQSYPQAASFGQLAERTTIQLAESFNEPFRAILNPILSLASGGNIQWQDQRDYLEPAASSLQRSLDVGAESTGTILSMLVPYTAASRAYQTVQASAPFLRGTLPEALVRNLPKDPTFTQRAGQRLADVGQLARSAPDMLTRQAVTAPGQNVGFEAASALGAGVGAAIAEAFMPGSPGARATGEIVGGFSPLVMTLRGAIAAGPTIKGAVTDPKGTFSRVVAHFGKEERLKAKLGRYLEDAVRTKLLDDAKSAGTPFSEDMVQREISNMVEALGRPNDLSRLTSGLKTGNESLLAYESFIMSNNPGFRGERNQMVRNAFKELDEFISVSLASGDPTQMRVAADLARSRYNDMIDESLQQAQRSAAEAMAKVENIDPAEQSRIAYETITDSLRRSRLTENQLWSQVPDVNPFASVRDDAFSNTIRTAERLQSGMPEADRLPFMADVNKMRAARDAYLSGEMAEEQVYGTKKLVSLRSRLLEESRRRAQDSPARARVYSELAEAVRLDLEAIPEVGPEYTRAREFSRAISERFRYTFGRGAIVPEGEGSPSITPETLLQVAFGAGGYRGAQRFRELEQAAVVPRLRTTGELVLDADILGPSVRSAQEEFIRSRASQMVNADGQLTRSSLSRFLNNPENQRLLETMPDLARDLSDLDTANAVLREVTQATKIARSQMERSAFSALLGDAPPDQAIAGVLRMSDSTSRVRELSQIARDSGDAAVEGLKHSIINFAYSGSSTNTGTSFIRMKSILESPVSAGEASPLEMLRSNRIMTEAELDNFMTIVNRGVEIENALANPRVTSITMEAVDPLSDLMIRIVGSKVGTTTARQMGGDMGAGQGLIAAGAGVRAFKSVLQRKPIGKLKELSIRAAREPDFMREVLLTRYTPQNRARLEGRLELFMVNSGITLTEDPETEAERSYNDLGLWEEQQ